MTRILVKKLLRDVRFGLIVVALLLFLFELLWARVTRTVSGDLLITIDKMTKETPQLGVKTFIDIFFSKGREQISHYLMDQFLLVAREFGDGNSRQATLFAGEFHRVCAIFLPRAPQQRELTLLAIERLKYLICP